MSTNQKSYSISHPHDEYIRDNYLTTTIKDMAAKIGRSEFYVRSRILHMGILLPQSVLKQRRLKNLNSTSGITKKNASKSKLIKPRVEELYPYRIGDRVRVILGTEPGDFRVTYGQVIRVEEKNKPVVEYTNLSGLRLSDFDRHVYRKEVALFGLFHVHREQPGDDRVETKPYRTIKGDDF